MQPERFTLWRTTRGPLTDLTRWGDIPRFVEIIIAALGILIMLPMFVVVAAWIKLHDGGPVFYRARRVGRDARPFLLLKFRSMVLGADRNGGALTTAGDSRVTPVGRFLRRFKLDELPQLWNVLKGEMSFVGPRPEDPRYTALYSPEQRRVLSVRPGITSPASLTFRDESALLTGDNAEQKYITEILPHKLTLELDYLTTRTVWTDLTLILRTLLALTH